MNLLPQELKASSIPASETSSHLLHRSHSFQSFASKLALSLCNGAESITPRSLFAKMEERGILSSDPRLIELHRAMDGVDIISRSNLTQLIPKNLEVFKKLFYDKLAIPDWPYFQSKVKSIYEETKQNRKGKVASYIPQIAKANPEHFGVSICTIDGQQMHIGDCNVDFSVQSCCKIVNYCIALEEHGGDVVHKYVGKEPSGQQFNAITLDKKCRPHNPCTNAGAIMVCALIGRETNDIDFDDESETSDEFLSSEELSKMDETNRVRIRIQSMSPPSIVTETAALPSRAKDTEETKETKDSKESNHPNQNFGSPNKLNFRRMSQSFQYSLSSATPLATFEADRFELVNMVWGRLFAGAKIGFSNSVYLSEKSTGHRNYALGHFMYEQTPGFPPNTNLKGVLEFYFQCCSLEVTARKLSYVAATLANGGINPLTGERIFEPDTVRHCLSIMFCCGMYDLSGEFAFKVGIPSKSGVSGAIISIVPNVMGVCTFSPCLDGFGNSVRGVHFLTKLSEEFAFHHFDNPEVEESRKVDPTKSSIVKSHSYNSLAAAKKQRDSLSKCIDTDGLNSELACFKILSYAAAGDLFALKRMYFRGCDLKIFDYDQRTPLHLAASCGHIDIVEYLIESKCYSVEEVLPLKDRWGGSPLDDAIRENHQDIVEYFRSKGITIPDDQETEIQCTTPDHQED